MPDHIVWSNGYAKGRTAVPASRRRPPRLRVSEKAFQAQVVDLMRLSGFRLVYHTYDSRRSASGFPDLVAVRRPRIIFAELKVASNQPTPAQLDWLDELHQCDAAESYVWWPEDLDDIRRILARDYRDSLDEVTR